LAAELAFAERHHTSISVILLDIDRFKQVNDQHGHQVGDQVLERVAAVASEQIRTEDVVARYGGEEFMVVLRETPVAGAEALAERIRRVVAETPIVKPDGQTLSVTLSAGCAALACTGSVSVEALIRLADRRLYQAKEQGRNRVTGASQPSTSVEAVALPELEPKSLVDPLDVMSRALDGLSGETKVVVGLRLLENCTFPEIAAVFGVTEERARELYESGLLQLSELLLRPEALARS
jgi:diguanylate cyclase (GGDEF)-like protein